MFLINLLKVYRDCLFTSSPSSTRKSVVSGGIFKFFYVILSVITFPIFAILFILRHPLWLFVILLVLAGGAAYFPISQGVKPDNIVSWYQQKYADIKVQIVSKAANSGSAGYLPQSVLDDVKKMTVAEQYRLYISLKPTGNRSVRKETLCSLGLKFFDADVKRLNLYQLEELLNNTVQTYQKESVQEAIANGIAQPHNKREELYNRMISTSREEKRKILKELGVDINAIELNRYSLSPIKHALAATLGIELEK